MYLYTYIYIIYICICNIKTLVAKHNMKMRIKSGTL